MVTPAALSPERQQVITATDSTILLGAVPEDWGTPDSVWLDKMGLSIPKKPALSMFLGHVFEPHIRRSYMERPDMAGYSASIPGFIRMDDLPFGCTPDGWVEDALGMTGHGFEAKSTTSKADWGEEGTEDIPDRVYIQVQHSMMVTGATRWDVGMFLYDREDKEVIACYVMEHGELSPEAVERFIVDRKFYTIVRNEDMIRQIKDAGMEFWNAYILTKTRPSDASAAVAVEIAPKCEDVVNDMYANDIVELIELRKAAKIATDLADAKAQSIRSILSMLNTTGLKAGGYQAKIVTSTRSGKPDFEVAFTMACNRGSLSEQDIAHILRANRKPNAVSHRLDVKESK